MDMMSDYCWYTDLLHRTDALYQGFDRDHIFSSFATVARYGRTPLSVVVGTVIFIYPGYQFSSKPTTSKFYRGGDLGSSPSPEVRACVMLSGMTNKMNQTMYLLFLLFLERSGHMETVASVSSTKCVPDHPIYT